jgi:hypothetical protein
MSDCEFHTCEWCGATPLWHDEMSSEEPGKCIECVREECSHSNILRSYLGSSNFRARFVEHCIKCDAQREIKVYFHNRYPDRGEWEWE